MDRSYLFAPGHSVKLLGRLGEFVGDDVEDSLNVSLDLAFLLRIPGDPRRQRRHALAKGRRHFL